MEWKLCIYIPEGSGGGEGGDGGVGNIRLAQQEELSTKRLMVAI